MPITPKGTAYDFYPARNGGENRRTIVLIHGLGLCRHLWNDHLDALTQDFDVLNYDFYGHGESSPPTEQASLSVYARQILELMDDLSIDKIELVGFSIGGMINRRFALDFPERLNSLVILNSPHEREPNAQIAVEERASQVASEGAMATMDAALIRWFTPEFLANRSDVAEKVRAWRGLADVKAYPDACMVLAAGVKELIRPEKPIDIPALVMTCENDSGSTPHMTFEIAKEISPDAGGAETLVVPKLQHLGLMEDPKVYTNAILNFLNT
ncbi:MAG: alpha/beta fold hydrolase [Alphaproteobacteria bacterium]